MNLRKLNDLLGKFQPLIQTVGIPVLIAGVVFAYVQIRLSLKELKAENRKLLIELDPRWRVNLKKEEDNALIDEIEFSSLNSAYNVQGVEVLLLHNLTPFRFTSTSRQLATEGLKARIAKVYLATYKVNSEGCFPCYETSTYPLAIKVHFERFGFRSDTTILFDYHFTVYHTKTKLRIKSNSFEFISYLGDDSTSQSRDLIAYNLSHSFLSNISEARQQIKILLGLRDSTYRPIFRYAYSNLKLFRRSVKVVDSQKKALVELVLQMPLPLADSSAIRRRYLIIDNINRNLSNYDSTLVGAVLRIQSFEKQFYKTESIPRDSILAKPIRYLNEKSWKEWRQLNYELITLAATRISI